MLSLFEFIEIYYIRYKNGKKYQILFWTYKNISPIYYNKVNITEDMMLCRKIEKNINKKMEKFTKNYRQICIIDVKYKM